MKGEEEYFVPRKKKVEAPVSENMVKGLGEGGETEGGKEAIKEQQVPSLIDLSEPRTEPEHHYLGLWRGRILYNCRYCSYNTLHIDEMEEHLKSHLNYQREGQGLLFGPDGRPL